MTLSTIFGSIHAPRKLSCTTHYVTYFIHVLLDAFVSRFLLLNFLKLSQKSVLVPYHHELEKLILLNLNCDFLHRVVILKIVILQIRPFEVLLKGKLIFKSKSLVRISTLLSCFVIKNQEETGVNIVLSHAIVTS